MASPTPRQHSLFYAQTLADVRAVRDAAMRDGASGGEAGGASGGEASAIARACDTALEAARVSDAGRDDEARRLLKEAVEAAGSGVCVPLLFMAFQFHFRLGEYDEAEKLARRRLEVVPAVSAEAARACTNLGLVHYFRKEHVAAEAMYRRALAIDRALGDERGEARDLGNLAMIFEERGTPGDLDLAEGMYREALAKAERAGPEALDVAATKVANLGDIARARGKREEARALWTRAAEMFTRLGNARYREQMEEKLRESDA